jgi:hypothetical protein
MAGVNDLFTDLLARIRTEIPEFQFVHIWNNQLEQLEDGLTYAFPFPNCFVEIASPNDYTPIGRGYSTGELVVRIHIGHEEYDAGGGNFEENRSVFSLRNKVVNKLNNYQPIATSSLMRTAEQQDYGHTNVYHYIVEFRCAFIDEWGGWEAQHETIEAVIEELNTNIAIVAQLESTFDKTFDKTFN